ncbi:hypothetical protein M3212_11650 [Alkalihalobacillus oceani]|uniref:hypothetical protein n=1 Tax=Halalkalibacter oceani TaxID=1653776 RepID=UPI00203E3556|nr:hypothetical protein [Halalkalibacter oceani]MCM3761438.1 hypothetical protein [Halalkalibacter oceani]
MKENDDLIIHLPDLSFVQWCEERYGLNRGVYNTIDEWFFLNGTKDILKRRKKILHFLANHSKECRNGRRMKFGHGRLTTLLTEYLEVGGRG